MITDGDRMNPVPVRIDNAMLSRIIGIETEYGCLIHEDRPRESPERIAFRIKEAIFKKRRLGLMDLHHRGHDEPPGNGGFLLNGGRIYLDMGHLEYASPECLGLADIVAYDRAGDRLLQQTIDELGLSDRVSLIKNNVDHMTGATFGSHENYLMTRQHPLEREGPARMIPFLVTRQIFTGSGRVGALAAPEGYILLDPSQAPQVDFQLSQRADHIVNDMYEWVQFNRAIINTRDEPLADPRRFRRVHLLVGDSNMLEYATALKLGTTSVMLALIEEGAGPEGLTLADPVADLRGISRDPQRRWRVTLENGKQTSAIEVQETFLRCAEKNLAGKDPDTDWVLREWRATLAALADDLESLVGKIDWVTKRWLLESYMQAEGVGWTDAAVTALDLEYHNLNPARGLCLGLEQEGTAVRRTTDGAITLAMTSPPRNTRASARGELVRALLDQNRPYVINWSVCYLDGAKPFEMTDPFRTYTAEAQRFIGEAPSRNA